MTGFGYFNELYRWILYEIQDVKNNQTYFNAKLKVIKKLVDY